MTRPDQSDEVHAIQEQSEELARQSASGFPPPKPVHATTTLAVRLVNDDADAIIRLAEAEGVPTSTLLRSWILTGLKRAQGDSVGVTLTELEQGLRRLRRALG